MDKYYHTNLSGKYLVHALFRETRDSCYVLDYQFFHAGSVLFDLADMIFTSMSLESAMAGLDEMVTAYYFEIQCVVNKFQGVTLPWSLADLKKKVWNEFLNYFEPMLWNLLNRLSTQGCFIVWFGATLDFQWWRRIQILPRESKISSSGVSITTRNTLQTE